MCCHKQNQEHAKYGVLPNSWTSSYVFSEHTCESIARLSYTYTCTVPISSYLKLYAFVQNGELKCRYLQIRWKLFQVKDGIFTIFLSQLCAVLGGTFVDVRVAQPTLPLFPHWGLLSRRAAMHRRSVFHRSWKFLLGSGFKIPVWRYPVGVDQGPVPVSRSFFLLFGLVFIFSVLYCVCTRVAEEPDSEARHVFWLSHVVYYLAIVNCV
jgi:hypothetical protein